MGYTEYLKDLLRPLQVYNLDDGYGAAELEALGKGLDRCCAAGEQTEQEGCIPTAETLGLEKYESILPQVPISSNLELRRQALMALLSIDDGSFTEPILNRILSGCGIYAQVSETSTWYTVIVRFPDVRGKPERFPELQKRIEAILPCHLEILYEFCFFTWEMMEQQFTSWEALEAAVPDWETLETYEGAQDD